MLEIINMLKRAYNQAAQVKGNNQDEDDWEIHPDRVVWPLNDFQRSGSQGDVFLGRFNNHPVAVKRFRDGQLADIRHLKDLRHEHIITFHGAFHDRRRNLHYVVMEFCPKGTLAQLIHGAHLIISPANLCDFSAQIASAMKYLHSKNIIHGDLKPSNILVSREYKLKISDFGTHKVLDGKPSNNFSSSQAGTYAYMAPEVIRSETYSFPIDVWSYGVVLWEMFLGLHPYNGLHSSAVVWAVGNNSIHLPIPTDFPEGLSFILTQCWQPDSNDRMTFQKICMMLKGVIPELKKISKERWPPIQAGWRKEAKDELQKYVKDKKDPIDDESLAKKQKAYEEAVEEAQRRRDRSNHLHMKLQECCMLVMRERREVERRELLVTKREKEVAEREKELERREEELAQMIKTATTTTTTTTASMASKTTTAQEE